MEVILFSTFAEHDSDMQCIGTELIVYGLLCLNNCYVHVLSILVYCSEILNVQSLELYPATESDLIPDSLNHLSTFIK